MVAAVTGGKSVPRGFPETDASVQDLLALAAVPDGLPVTFDGTSGQIRPDVENLVAAGELRQRLLALARAHGLEITVDVTTEH